MGSVKRRRRSSHTMRAVVCGLDVHKDSTCATILNSEGKTVDQTRMENEKVFSYLSRFNVGKVAMESFTQVAPLYRQLKVKALMLCFLTPRRPSESRRLELKVMRRFQSCCESVEFGCLVSFLCARRTGSCVEGEGW